MRRYLNILLLLLSLFCAACQKKEKVPHSSLNINFQIGDLSSLMPSSLIDMRGRVLGKLIYEGLTRIDHNGNPQLAAAKSVAISQDGMEYVFKLKKQFWSDGTKVTADHYVDAWLQALTPGSDAPRADLFYLIKNGQKAKKGELDVRAVGLQALNQETLKVTLEHPSSHFLHLVSQPIFAPVKENNGFPLFNGPYKIQKWEKGVGLYLEKNPLFWNQEAVQIQAINIHFVTDPMTAYYMYEKKELDWIGDPIAPLSKEANSQLIDKKMALSLPVDRFYWIYLNMSHPILKSQKIRKALYLSIDREQIAHHIFNGAQPMLTPVHQSMIPYYPEKVDEHKAKALFSEGIRELNLTMNPTLVFSYAQYANMKPLAEYLKNSWEERLGLQVELQVNEWGVLRQNFEKAFCSI